MTEGKALFVAIANGNYAELSALTRAVPDAEKLAEVICNRHQFEPKVLPNLERGPLLDEIDAQLCRDRLSGGKLIVIWIGHAKIGVDHTLRLIGCSKGNDVEVASAGELGEWAARTGAQQFLVVLDTCWSGGGVVEAARLADAVNSGRAAPEKAWFGVLAASLKDQRSVSGALVPELARLLNEGPRNADFRWDKSRPFIRGDDLVQALLSDFSEPRQKPYPIQGGLAWDFVHNPRYEPDLPDQPVEHLLQAARGGVGEESYFTGRERALGEIVKWVRRSEPGLFVITGPPGCGKSAVAGRIVSLSASAERARLLAEAPIPETLDPGEGCVDAQLQTRGVTVEAAAEKLARQLGLETGAGPYAVIAEAEHCRRTGDPLLIVVDGLDEARDFSREMAAEFLAPLARQALVLVATRDVLCEEKTLIQQLGPAAQMLDLGEDIEGTRQDIRSYVKRRLDSVAPVMDPELVAEALVAGSGSEPPGFLLARLVTSQLRDQPVDTSSDGWQLLLATTVESALERDLQSVILTIGGKPHPTAAREMICALAFSHGGGFPADDVWPAVSAAVSPTRTEYTRNEAYALLEVFGRHIIASYEGDQPVYRIAHQRLVDYVGTVASASTSRESTLGTKAAAGAAILSEYEKLLDAGLGPRAHTYLWRYAWRHLVHADPNGLAGLRRLVERDPEAFLPKLAAGLELAATMAMSEGHTNQALKHLEEAVGVRRQLADGLKLAMALFLQAYTQAAMGDLPAAEAATAEAVKVAKDAADRPESRNVLQAVLVARAHTQLVGGHCSAALFLAKEAVALSETNGAGEEKDAWPSQAAAYAVMARAYLLLENFEAAEAMCQRAIDLLDRLDSTVEYRDLCNEALCVLATAWLQRAILSPPEADGKYPTAVSAAAQRVLDDYRQTGRQGTIADISVAYGILCYVRCCVLDQVRGVNTVDFGELYSLWNEAIEMLSPFADQMMEAAIALAEAVALLPSLPVKPDPDTVTRTIAFAERCLRRFAGTIDLAAVTLGQLLNSETEVQVMQAMQGAAIGLSGVLDRQKEAVALLRRLNSWFARYCLARAVSQLCNLLILSGQAGADEDTALRAEAIEVWRSLVGKFPDAPMQLVNLLCDQAAVLVDRRTGEAADLAREAVERAENLPQPQSQVLLGIAENNLAGAQLILGGAPDTRVLLQRAIGHLEPYVSHPVVSGGLANACLNLALVELNEGRYSEALPLAERALTLFDMPDMLPHVRENRPTALLALGRAQRGIGREEIGVATLHDVINKLCTAAINDENNIAALAYALNTAAPDFWAEVVDGFADQPELQETLKLMRWPSTDELNHTVEALADALDKRPPTEHRTLRAIARKQRSRAPGDFDAAWQEMTGAIPGWLRLDPAQEWLVIAWWNTRNWRLSRDYLKTHPMILNGATEIVLEEFDLEGGDQEHIDIHRQLLNETRKYGADVAYAPRIAASEVYQWITSDDPEQYLADHPELFRPEITALLQQEAEAGDAESIVFVAILDLARRDEGRLAFQAANDPLSTFDHLKAALRSTDITRLAALATIMRERADEPDLKLRATAALVIARLVEGRKEETDALIATVLNGSTASDRDKLLAILGEAIANHPTAASELARLIGMITR